MTVVGQVFNLSGQDEILSYGTTIDDSPVLSHRARFCHKTHDLAGSRFR